MASFIAVPAEILESWLQERKFERTVQRNEVVYTRSSAKNANVKMKVYTSIRTGQMTVRAAGQDAIRVCVVFENSYKSFGIGRFPAVMRVHSVESVLKRLREKLVEAAARADEWIQQDFERYAARQASYITPQPAVPLVPLNIPPCPF
jgi:hypothetical protein